MEEAIRRVGKKAQITLPKRIREKLSLAEGDRVLLKLEGENIVITPVVTVPKQNYLTEDDLSEALAEAESEFFTGKAKTYEDAEQLFKDAGWITGEEES
ncbi:MAG: AbrB/MazE/SpoVT family DNA-binding domain-containing protein [Bacillota bacterium]